LGEHLAFASTVIVQAQFQDRERMVADARPVTCFPEIYRSIGRNHDLTPPFIQRLLLRVPEVPS
jgi:hypothetical protein